jgi:hypothetical protein
MSPILQDGRILATIPQRLVPAEAPKIQGLAVRASGGGKIIEHSLRMGTYLYRRN